MNIISIKSDLVLSHIESLPVGRKVSVRELSDLLQVSEGTAYKGIKEAEMRGIVRVKPKAGTVRVEPEKTPYSTAIQAAELVHHLSLSIVAGRNNTDRLIRRILVCDGSEDYLEQQMADSDPSSCICLCGERKEIQEFVISKSANLLLTDGVKASWALMSNAERNGAFILSSPLNTFSLMQLLLEELQTTEISTGTDQIGNWMQTPDYLYYNDIIADWQQMYVESSFAKQYPIVDDDLEIIGGIDLWKAAAGIPSEKLRSILADSPDFPVVDYRETPEKTAKMIVTNRKPFPAVSEGKKLLGIVTANDLLRYYMYVRKPAREGSAGFLLEIDSSLSNEVRAVFHIRLPESETGKNCHIEADLMLSAIDCHLHDLGFSSYQSISSSIICVSPVCFSDSLIVSSIMKERSENMLSFEVELNDDTTSYSRAFFVVMVQKEKEV